MILPSPCDSELQQQQQQQNATMAAAFASPLSSVSSFGSIAATKAAALATEGERANYAVRTARFRQKKPHVPIRRSLTLPVPPGIDLADLLDSPILQPPHQAEPSPSTGVSPLPPITRGNGTMVVPARESEAKSSALNGNQTIIYKPVPRFRYAALSTVMGISAGTPKAPDLSLSVVDTPPKERRSKTRVSSELGHQLSDKIEINHLIVQTELSPVETSSEDGFNWRKYGQKLVKNSKFPRSYYRCAHPGCPVKKMVEQSKVVIKGDHVHPKPQAIRRMPSNGTNGTLSSSTSKSKQLVKSAGGLLLLPEPSPVSDHTEGPIAKWNRVDEEEHIVKGELGNVNVKDDAKCRKKIKIGETVSKLSLRTFREPRHVERVKCLSDIVDDGYRWCKYGQKTIKGNPHPRSYYKCHSPGCPVRKHVERSATDESTVISTYEGNHNHEAPAPRFKAGSFATGMAPPPSSMSKSNLLPLNYAGTKHSEVNESGIPMPPSDHRFLNGTDGCQVDRKSGSNVTPIKALPVESHFRCSDKEAVASKALSFLKSGVDGRSAFQRAESSKQGPVLAPKLEPDEQRNANS